ncbi:MAG TPA: serine protease [Coleofasciculaceae cyanobacterium]|jgi:S1-C subfamily serine protease
MTISIRSNEVQSKAAIRQVENFRQQFGEGHFYLACHAALPVALTPDLLYCLWVNFQRDVHGGLLNIPWIAVTDLLLSSLCETVGHELYEIDAAIQRELMAQLQRDPRFGQERIQELANFVIVYVAQQLESPEPDIRDFAQTQKWRAVAYINPKKAANDISTTLAQLSLTDITEWIRMATLLETLATPLSDYPSLLTYAAAMADFLRGKEAEAAIKFQQILNMANQLQVAGVHLPVPAKVASSRPEPVPIPNLNWISIIDFVRQHYRWLAISTFILCGLVGTSFYVPKSQKAFLPILKEDIVDHRIAMYAKPAVVGISAGCTGTYIYKGIAYPYRSAAVGSGFIIDSNGFILVSARIASFAVGGRSACKDRLFNVFVERLTKQEDIENVSPELKDEIEKQTELQDFKYTNQALLPNGAAFSFEIKNIGGFTFGGLDAGNDVAVVKIEVSDAPTLKLGDSGKAQVQDSVMVVGYPSEVGDATFVTGDKAFHEATILLGGTVSGAELYEMNSPTLEVNNIRTLDGMSGGPVLNQQGEVIGMLSLRDSTTSVPYATPTSTLQEYIRESGAQNEPSATDLLYKEGLDLFWKGDFQGAKAKFETVRGLFPLHSEVDELIRRSEQQIAGRWTSRSYIPLLVIIGAAIAGLLGAYFALRRRSSTLT